MKESERVPRTEATSTPPVYLHFVGCIVVLRIMSSFAWLDSAIVGKDAKLAPIFLSGQGLADAITEKFSHLSLTPGIADFLHGFVLPHAYLFAPLIAFSDLAIGLSLSLGLFTRLGALLAILRAITNILVAGGAGPDTIGYNAMLVVAGGICIASRAGRELGVDRILLARWPSSRFLRTVA